MATVWITVTVLKCRRLHLFCMPYILSKVQIHRMWNIDWKRLFWNVWIIEDMVDLPIFSCSSSVIVSHDWQHGLQLWPLFNLTCASVLCLFCLFLCFASVHFHASLLLFFLSSVDPDRFLDVHPLSEFVTLVLSSVYICFPIEGSLDAPLSYFRELVHNWMIYVLFISERLDSLG